jgi:hypothetical protein
MRHGITFSLLTLGLGCGSQTETVDFDDGLGETLLPEVGACSGFDSSTCGSGHFCLDGSCEPTRKRQVDVGIDSLAAGPMAPWGEAWEELLLNASDPDFIVEVYWSTDEDYDGCVTPEIESMTPVWNLTCESKIVAPGRMDGMGIYGDAWLEISVSEWDINGWGNDVGHLVGVWAWTTPEDLDGLTELAAMGEQLVLTADGGTELYISLELVQ